MKSDVRIIHNKLLGGWYIVRGAHDTPLGGRFDSKAAAQAHLDRNKPARVPCGYFALCDREAVTTREMGPVGTVHCCQRCADRYDAMSR